MQATPPVSLSDPTNQDVDNRLREFAHHLAKTQIVEISHSQKTDLLEHLNTWEQTLRNANAIFKTVPSNDLPVSRAGEWMLDNFFIIQQTFRQIEEDLPASFLNQLPQLEGTPLQGHPRIFALTWEWLGYCQSQFELTQFVLFVQNYQQITPLTIGELWALPSMLRMGILEWLIYAAVELTGVDTPKGLCEIPSQFASPMLANETTVANCFLSLRLLSTTDWKAFFEQTSRVEQILRDDPAKIYANMDFDTRNSYRRVVEELALCSNLSEEEVALKAVELARSTAGKASGRQTHVGFYLRDSGRTKLEVSIRYQPGLSLRIRRTLLATPTLTYLGSITILTVLFGIADVCHTFRRLAYSAYYCRRVWDWVGFRSGHPIRELERDPFR
jgi:cyclic beta-1,2-glucan synthetase